MEDEKVRPRNTRRTVNIPAQAHARLRERSRREGRHVQWYVARALERYLDEEDDLDRCLAP